MTQSTSAPEITIKPPPALYADAPLSLVRGAVAGIISDGAVVTYLIVIGVASERLSLKGLADVRGIPFSEFKDHIAELEAGGWIKREPEGLVLITSPFPLHGFGA